MPREYAQRESSAASQTRSRNRVASQVQRQSVRITATALSFDHLQRTIGNRAVQRLLSAQRQAENEEEDEVRLQRTIGPVQLRPTMSTKAAGLAVQRMKLTGNKKAQYRNRYETWKGDTDDFDGFVDWCHSTTQADDIMANLTYDQWGTVSVHMNGEEANAFTAREAFREANAGGSKVEKEVDKYATVKAKIRSEGLNPARFSAEDMDAIEAGKDEHGWSGAIQSIWTQKTQKEESARLATERRKKYARAKQQGDSRFQNGLVKDVWNVAYSVATSGDANANTTVAHERPDNEIIGAVQPWRTAPELGGGLGGAGKVTNFHVPGGGSPIEDKSRRANNPDPTRGRQADFISVWSGTHINVHVDADPQH